MKQLKPVCLPRLLEVLDLDGRERVASLRVTRGRLLERELRSLSGGKIEMKIFINKHLFVSFQSVLLTILKFAIHNDVVH